MKYLYLLPPLSGAQKFWCECGHVVSPIMMVGELQNKKAANSQYYYGCEHGHAVQIKDERLNKFVELHERFYVPVDEIEGFSLEEFNKIIDQLLVMKTQILFEDPATDFVNNDIVVDFTNKHTGETIELSLSQIVTLLEIMKLQNSPKYKTKFNYHQMSGVAS